MTNFKSVLSLSKHYMLVLLLMLLCALAAMNLFFDPSGGGEGSGIGGTGKFGGESGFGGTGGPMLKLGALDSEEKEAGHDLADGIEQASPQLLALNAESLSAPEAAVKPALEELIKPLPSLSLQREPQAIIARYEPTIGLIDVELPVEVISREVALAAPSLSVEPFEPSLEEERQLVALSQNKTYSDNAVNVIDVNGAVERTRVNLPLRPDRPERPAVMSQRIAPVQRVAVPPPPVRPMRI